MKEQLEAVRSERANSARQEALVAEVCVQATVDQASLKVRRACIFRGGLVVTEFGIRVASLEVALENLTEDTRDETTASVEVAVAVANRETDTAVKDLVARLVAESAAN